MGHRIVIAGVFAAASLLATGAYAGSPYYDANGQMMAPAVQGHARASTAQPSYDGSTVPATGQPSAAVSDEPTVAADATAGERYGTVIGVPLPKMDADGFQHREGKTWLDNHAEGTMGAP